MIDNININYTILSIIYMTAEKIKGADFTHRIKFILLVY